jgi:hypothetical protein
MLLTAGMTGMAIQTDWEILMLSPLLKISRKFTLSTLVQDRQMPVNVHHDLSFGEAKKPRCDKEHRMSASLRQMIAKLTANATLHQRPRTTLSKKESARRSSYPAAAGAVGGLIWISACLPSKAHLPIPDLQ